MKKLLCRILDFFCFIAENLSVIGGIGLIAIMILTLTDVILRMLGSTIIGNVELICCLICVVVFLGFGKSTFDENYTKVEILNFRKAEPVVRIIMDIIHFGMCAFASYYCFVQSTVTKKMSTTSLMLKIPRWPFIVLAGIGFLLITVSIPLSRYREYMLKSAERKRATEVL